MDRWLPRALITYGQSNADLSLVVLILLLIALRRVERPVLRVRTFRSSRRRNCNTPGMTTLAGWATEAPGWPGGGRHCAQVSALLAAILAARAAERAVARSSGTAAPVPRYISSGVWPLNAE